MKTYLRIIGFARPFGLLIPQYLLYTILFVIFSMINLMALIPVLKLLFNSSQDQLIVTELAGFEFSEEYFKNLFYYYFGTVIRENGRISALFFLCIFLVITVILANIFNYLALLLQSRTRVNVVRNLRKAVFEKVTRFDLEYFSETKKGDIMSRVTSDIQQIEIAVVNSMKGIFKEPFLIIGQFVLLFMISTELTLYISLLIPTSGAIIGYIGKQLKRRAKRTQESLGRMSGILEETISGIRIIKAFSARSYTLNKFGLEVDRYAKQNYKMTIKSQLVGPLTQVIAVVFLSVILMIGGKMVLDDSFSLNAAEFIVFLIIFGQILVPAKNISSAFANIQQGIAAGDRVFELLDTKVQVVEDDNPIEINQINTEIRFENVDFKYDARKVLSAINFTIPKGKIVALVGPSGGGKSTIADLIPRFYDTTEGQVLLDGIDIRRYSFNSLRGLMGIVTQESILFNDSVKQNIAFGKSNATMEEIIEASKIANAHEFIQKMEHGYDTMIGERGVKLSGGQRQRLSIARAVLKNPQILILDEATSALDSESEKLVQDAIYNLTKNRTTLVIAHRLSTIQNADIIIVIKEGKILQLGTHDQLMANKGMYRKLIDIQSV